MRPCWRELRSIDTIGDELKNKYNSAIMVEEVVLPEVSDNRMLPFTSDSKAQLHSRNSHIPISTMVYNEASPDYCDGTDFGGGTSGRICDSKALCETLCCGRGYQSKLVGSHQTRFICL